MDKLVSDTDGQIDGIWWKIAVKNEKHLLLKVEIAKVKTFGVDRQ